MPRDSTGRTEALGGGFYRGMLNLLIRCPAKLVPKNIFLSQSIDVWEALAFGFSKDAQQVSVLDFKSSMYLLSMV